jgi:hypothetical protein
MNKNLNLKECGHVEIVSKNPLRHEKCNVKTSRKVKLLNGKSIHICPLHERLYKTPPRSKDDGN